MTDEDLRAASSAGWTLETLYQAFSNRITDLEKRLDERAEAQQRAVDYALTAAEKAVNAALASSEKAVLKAETSQQRVNETMSDFKDALRDQAVTLMPRAETEALTRALDEKITSGDKVLLDKIDVLSKLVNTDYGKREGVKITMGVLVSSITVTAVVAGAVASIANALLH